MCFPLCKVSDSRILSRLQEGLGLTKALWIAHLIDLERTSFRQYM